MHVVMLLNRQLLFDSDLGGGPAEQNYLNGATTKDYNVTW